MSKERQYYKIIFFLNLIILLVHELKVVWGNVFFVAQDIPGHLATAWIVSNINKVSVFNQFFVIKITPIPNLFIHILFPVLLKIFSPEISLKIVITLYIILFQISLWRLTEILFNKKFIFYKILVLNFLNILVFNHFLFKGNLNFCFSMVFFLTGLILLLKFEHSLRWVTGFFIITLLLYFTHLFGWLSYVIVSVIYLGTLYLSKKLKKKFVLWTILPLLGTVIIAVIYILFFSSNSTISSFKLEPLSGENIKIKSSSLWWTFLNFDLVKERKILQHFYFGFWFLVIIIIIKNIKNIKKIFKKWEIISFIILLIVYYIIPLKLSFIVRPYERILPFVYLTGTILFKNLSTSYTRGAMKHLKNLFIVVLSIILFISNIKYINYISDIEEKSNKVYQMVKKSCEYIPAKSRVYILIQAQTMAGKINLYLHLFNCMVWIRNVVTSDIFATTSEILRWKENHSLNLSPYKIPAPTELNRFNVVFVWGINASIHDYLISNNFKLKKIMGIIGIYIKEKQTDLK